MATSEELKARRALATVVGIARAQLEMATWDRTLDPLQRIAELSYALQRIEDEGCEAMPHLCTEAAFAAATQHSVTGLT